MTALTAGAWLLVLSAQRVERATERSMRAGFNRGLNRVGHSWIRRAESVTAGAGGAIGVGIILYANQRLRSEARRSVASGDVPAPQR